LAANAQMRFSHLISEALKQPLPGTRAQDNMAPPRRQTKPGPTDRPRQSAVLALLCARLHPNPAPGEGAGEHRHSDVRIIFTRRQAHLRHHAGQISFPGGRYEGDDPSLLHTALRETQEELGIAPERIRILGQLTPLFIAPSQNHVYPFVGWLSDRTQVKPNPAEVAEVVPLPLSALLTSSAVGTYQWRRNGEELTAPCYQVGETIIWGATAMMLSELLEVVRSALRSTS